MKSFSCLFTLFVVAGPHLAFLDGRIYARQADYAIRITPIKIQYTITATAGPNGSVSPGSVTVDPGADASFTATPDIGCEVIAWYLDDEQVQIGGESYTLSNIQANHSIHVIFSPLQYTITATAGPNGLVSPPGITVGYGDSATFTATPDYGYEVDTWLLDGIDFQGGGRTCTVSQIKEDHSLHVTFRQALAYSLDDIEFNDDEEFETRVINNNVVDPERPEASRVHVERVSGVGPDAGGVMAMHNLMDMDPASETYGQMAHARAKGIFLKTAVDEILVRFKYLFATSEPGVELVVYLSDSPKLLAPDDPERPQHYIEVARVPAPPFPRPGSAGSGHFAVFEKIVWAGHMDLNKGVYIELELVEPQLNGISHANKMLKNAAGAGSNTTYVDDWSPAVQCYGICLDINWDNFVDEADFLMVVGGCGCAATGEMACLEGALSTDGYMDSYDVVSWDWALNSDQRLLNYCGVPLVSEGVSMKANLAGVEASGTSSTLGDLRDLLITGKKGAANPRSKLEDGLYVFNKDGSWAGSFEPPSDRCNVRLVQGPAGDIYQLNSETGLVRLDGTNKTVVPPGKIRLDSIKEPRYSTSATIYIGIQNKGADSFGRPLLDAAFDADYIYVVPVVIQPDGGRPYTAAAKLKLLDAGNPPYEIVRLYDDPPLSNDNQYRDHLREIELDPAGNLYVLNVHAINESDILWKYAPDGTCQRLDLGRPDGGSHVPSPVAMLASKTSEMLYMTSAMYVPASNSTVMYGFSTKGAMALEKRITVTGIQHVTCMTEDPQTGTLWLSGFNMYNIPAYPDPTRQAFYYPYVAKIPAGSEQAERIALSDPGSHDLALPMSILWTAATKHGEANLHQSASFGLSDFALLAEHWLSYESVRQATHPRRGIGGLNGDQSTL